ncbi:MAG: hypothetical protein KAR57_01945 [Bacteroidales bacterium]|nr:hypothetical protein [Bacteroidales bacterium]
MEVKGTAVKSIKDYVEKKYSSQVNDWIQLLPESSAKIMNGGIFANNWYPMKDGAVEPTLAIAKMFYNNDKEKAALEAGRFSAEQGLKGVYKIFVRIASPNYLMQRARRVFTSYYSPSEISVANSHDKGLTLHITKFPNPEEVIEYRIAGWCEKALEFTNCKNVKANITQSLAKGDELTEIVITWN